MASFLLHKVMRAVPITFSVRQGDPIARLIYVHHPAPAFSSVAVGHVDDVEVVGKNNSY
jgi:hypothetical protein